MVACFLKAAQKFGEVFYWIGSITGEGFTDSMLSNSTGSKCIESFTQQPKQIILLYHSPRGSDDSTGRDGEGVGMWEREEKVKRGRAGTRG